MCFIKLSDQTGSIEVIVFPKVYAVSKSFILPDQIIVVSGKLESGDKSPTLIAESVITLEELEKQEEVQNSIEVSIPKNADRMLLSKIYQVLKGNPGQTKTFLVLSADDGSPKKFAVPFGAKRTLALERELTKLGCYVLE